MNEYDDNDVARRVFSGLVPRVDVAENATADRSRLSRSVRAGLPILVAGSVAAIALNLTGPVQPAQARTPLKQRGDTTELGKSLRGQSAAATTVSGSTATRGSVTVPASYRVAAGDTISDIASRFGLSTASVLAVNGLSWSSLIFPGQQLALSAASAAPVIAPEPVSSTNGRYSIVAGDTISAIAARFGVSTLSILTANGLGWSSIIYPGQSLAIPGLVGPGTPLGAAVPDLVGAVPEADHETPVVRSDSASTPPANSVGTTTPGTAAPVTAAPVASAPVTATPAPSAPAPSAPAPTAPAPAAPALGGQYTVVSGDTISGIATRNGMTTQALLDANGLTWSSVIYPGQVLAVPGSTPASTGGSVTLLTAEMQTNASIIISVGRSLGVPDYGIVIALAAAMQESSLRNLTWGDLDSVGLFQQRPSSGWGTVDQLTNPTYAAQLFYGGPSNPNRGYTRGLLDIPGWQSMTVAQAAQRVQISAYPDAYAKWETSARAWLAALG